MIDKAFLEAKLSHIRTYYQELENVLVFSDEEIKQDFLKLRGMERILQLIVDEIIDINNHIIRYANLSVPDDFQSSFMVLSDNKILPGHLAGRIAPVVGVRNRLVHRYEKIDLNILLDAVRNNKEDFREYVRCIFAFLTSMPCSS